jgi:type IV secretory pathway VirB4 component
VKLLAAAPERTMTHFIGTLQKLELREALAPYALGGAMGHLLDADKDGLAEGKFQVFEMDHLMGLGDKNAVPVLTYLFRRIEKRLNGRPTLLVLDEAWLMLSHPIFREKIREWLKVLRKANCAVVFATQSISDVMNSPIRDVLIESCPTKILLPNPEARQETSRKAYELLGMNDRQMDLIAYATPKRQYYYMSPMGRRLFDLSLGPVALAFVGRSGKKDIAMVRDLQTRFGGAWAAEWMAHTGVRRDWVDFVRNESK